MSNNVSARAIERLKKFGYAFISLDGHDANGYLSLNVLNDCGFTRKQFKANSRLIVDYVINDKGPCITRVHSLDGIAAGKPIDRELKRKKSFRSSRRTRKLEVSDQATGQLKFFNHDKGYGFLEPVGKGMDDVVDYFVHISLVPEQDQPYLQPNNVFRFQVGEDNGKQHAVILGLVSDREVTSDQVAAAA